MSLTINEELTQEATRLKAEIAQLNATSGQLDADGTPSPDAIMAQKRLPGLNDDYRALLQTLNAAPKQTPVQTAKDQQDLQERNSNQAGSGYYETNAEKSARLSKEAADNRAAGSYETPQQASDRQVAAAIASRAAPAHVTTPAELKANAIAQGEALDQLNAARLARGEILGPADEAALKSKYDMIAAEYTASVNQLAAETKSKETADTATTLWDRGAADREAARLLAQSGETRLAAGETRAQGAEARAALTARQTPQIAALKDQMTQAQANVASSIKLGIAPTRGMANAPYDAYARMQAILNEQPAQVAQLQPQQAPTAPQVTAPPTAPTAAPQIYDSSPQGSSIGGQAPNVPTPLWQQGPAATGMANDQTSLWGQDKPTQSLFLSTYNNDPILASQMWAKQHNAPPQAPTVGPPRAPTLN